MLSRDEILHAVEIQKRSYKFLRWLGEAIDRDFITFSRAHHYASAAHAALDWLEEHYQNIPEDTQPPRDRLREFSNYFGSYVTTSFDLIEEPGTRLKSTCGCYCPLYVHLVNVAHLQARKPSKGDKEKALKKCISRLEMLANEERLRLNHDMASSIARSPSQRRNAAYSAYGLSPSQDQVSGAEMSRPA